MKSKKTFYILGGVIIIAIVIVILFMTTNNIKANECSIDSDCDFFYIGGGPCRPCSYVDETFACMKYEEGIEFQKQNPRDDRGLVCSPCAENDFDRHICKCVNNKCIKELK